MQGGVVPKSASRKAKAISFTEYLAPLLDGCPRCGGVGCKECGEGRRKTEDFGYPPDDSDTEDDLDTKVDDDGVEAIRRRKRKNDESFARRLAMGVSMRAEADESVLDD